MILSISIALSVIFLDQWTKLLAQNFLSSRGSVPIIKNIFHFTLACNRGAAFSIFPGAARYFSAVAIFSICIILFMLAKPSLLNRVLGVNKTGGLVYCGLGLILGGAAGNLIDRLRFSYVVDFLDFRVWPVFNLADSAITVGGALIVWAMLRRER